MAHVEPATASTRFGSMMDWLSEPDNDRMVLVVSAAVLVAVGAADLATGPYVNMSLLYVLPIMAVAWSGRWIRGVVVAVLAATIAFLTNLVQQGDATLGAVIWNAGSRLVVDLVIVWLVISQRQMMRRLRIWPWRTT